MSPQAQLALLLWIPVVFYIFNKFPPRKAVIVSFIGGLLFLPERTGFSLPVIPDYQGMAATCYGIIFAVCKNDPERWKTFKPGWLDIPMFVWCICPFLSSMTNGLGAYDGFNETLTQTVTWGLPYLLGRLYLGDLDGLKELAINVIKGGLLYVPLCLYEGRMSPQLHNIVYGYYAHPSGISQAFRLGGYRPNVFMKHGLMVGFWMMTVALVALWLWQAGTVKKVWNYSLGTLVVVLILTFIWCRSTGAYIYLFVGVVMLFSSKFLKTNIVIVGLSLAICYYLYSSAVGTFPADEIVQFISDTINPDRAQSLEFRFGNEELLAEHAQDRLIFGWGGWGRNRIYDYNWWGELEDISVTDSLWIIAFGVNGLTGLAGLTGSLLVPAVAFGFIGHKPKYWFHPRVAPAAVLAATLPLFMLDSVLNYMFNPLFPLISGALSGLMLKPPEPLDGKSRQSGKVKSYVPIKQVQRKVRVPQVKLKSSGRSRQRPIPRQKPTPKLTPRKARKRRVTINKHSMRARQKAGGRRQK